MAPEANCDIEVQQRALVEHRDLLLRRLIEVDSLCPKTSNGRRGQIFRHSPNGNGPLTVFKSDGAGSDLHPWHDDVVDIDYRLDESSQGKFSSIAKWFRVSILVSMFTGLGYMAGALCISLFFSPIPQKVAAGFGISQSKHETLSESELRRMTFVTGRVFSGLNNESWVPASLDSKRANR